MVDVVPVRAVLIVHPVRDGLELLLLSAVGEFRDSVSESEVVVVVLKDRDACCAVNVDVRDLCDVIPLREGLSEAS